MLQKQAVDVSFASGLDTKTDPKRVQVGKFVQLQNTVFNKGGLLQKRNGYSQLSSLPSSGYSYLTTFNENLTAIGTKIAAYNNSGSSWVEKGTIQPLSLSTLPLIRNNLNQTAVDSAVADNGLICTVYLETDGTTVTNKYVVSDSITGQNIISPTAIPVASGVPTGGMRVFILGQNFIIVFTNVITATNHLQYITVNTHNPTVVGTNTDIASVYTPATALSWDGVVVNSRLYIAYNTVSGGQSIKAVYLTQSLILSGAATFATRKATCMSLCADITNPTNPAIYINIYESATPSAYTIAVDQNLNTLLAPTQFLAAGTILNLASAAQNGICTVFYEVSNAYSFDSSVATNYVASKTVTIAGTVSSQVIKIRSVGIASKAFIISDIIYLLSAFQSSYQSGYFLINGSSSTSASPVIAAKLAYQNGGGYLTHGLPSVTVVGSSASISYLFKDLVQAVNKDTNVTAGTQVNGIYSQTGINLASFTIGTDTLYSSEIGNDLHLTGGFLSMYDGYLPVEHNFFLYPDTDLTNPTDTANWSATGGSMEAKPGGVSSNTNVYYYQFTYEWTDNQGNAFRSAPSIPVAVTSSGSGSSGSVTLNIPTLRLTMKTANPVKVVIYRWSVGQQNYYQVTSISSPLLNDTTVDSVQFVDTLADATILGNNLIYTTGGVVEDVNAPASNILALFDTRLWLVDAEDRNLLWYSKQVIEATPVEMSDLFTLYVPPTTATQGSTGPISALAPMDDKLIIFKKNGAIVYINGNGPDNTGSNNQYSEPVFITGTVGCSNQKSIVLIPQGLLFQSDKGIWLLDRGLNTSYIGAPVEDFTTGATVLSAVSVPETNQVRFILDTGITLMYDYYYQQWGTFSGVPALSSCIFESMHTFINSSGATYQESAGQYLDGSNPVLMNFKTGPLRLGDLQNYQRAYFFYLLGTYLSPHKIRINISYDYESDPSQSTVITPTNTNIPYGSGTSQTPYGQQSPYGGGSSLENWRIFLERQRCMAFAIEFQEIFDSSQGQVAGAGFTLSGLNLVMGFKKGFRPQSSAESAG
jgi:hypothetical protein